MTQDWEQVQKGCTWAHAETCWLAPNPASDTSTHDFVHALGVHYLRHHEHEHEHVVGPLTLMLRKRQRHKTQNLCTAV